MTMKNKWMVRAAATVLAISLAAAAPVYGKEAGTVKAANAPALQFPDVAVDHWAIKYISKLGKLGIVEGDDYGHYNPNNPVTQEEVIIMAIRMMGLEDEAKKLGENHALPFTVSSFAQKHVVMAIEEQLIEPVQEVQIANDLSNWGKTPATREWVAKLAVTAAGKKAEAQMKMQGKTHFTDDANISAWARGYINEAVELGIVDGMEDGSFRPKDTVTRAQMAAFITRASAHLEKQPDNVAIGAVKTVSDAFLTITDENNTPFTFLLTGDTLLFGLEDPTRMIQPGDIKVGNEVYVIHQQGKATFVEVTAEEADFVKEVSLEGQIESADLASGRIVLVTKDGQQTVDLVKQPVIVDKQGKGMSFSQLEKGTIVEVKRYANETTYHTVVVKQFPINKTAQGTVEAVDLVGKTITVNEDGVGSVTYPLADSVVYFQANGQSGFLSELKARDRISYRVTINKVDSITMLQPYVEPVDEGTIGSIETGPNGTVLLIYRLDNKPVVYYLAPNAKVDIPGLLYANVGDLMKGDRIKIRLDEQDRVTEISVLERSIKTTYFNTVVSYEAESRILTVTTASGDPVSYRLTDSTVVEVDGNTVPIQNVALYLTKGKKVNITASDKTTNALKVQITSNYDGVVMRTNSANGEIVVQSVDGHAITFKLAASTRVITAESISFGAQNLKVGDRVQVRMAANQELVTDVLVVNQLTYRVQSVNETSRQLELLDRAGNVRTVSLIGVELVGPNGQALKVGEIPVDEPVEVTFLGNLAQRVAVLEAVRGQVLAVDAAKGQLTVATPNGNQLLNVGTNANVMAADGSRKTLANIGVNDRVEAYATQDGNYTIRIAEMVSRTLERYDALNRQLIVKRPTLSDPVSYPLHANAYVHNANGSLHPNYLMVNQTITLYLIDNKVIEVVAP